MWLEVDASHHLFEIEAMKKPFPSILTIHNHHPDMSYSHTPPGYAPSRRLEDFRFMPSPLSGPGSSFIPFPGSLPNESHQLNSSPVTPPSSELEALSLKGSSCLKCKGQKYGFTAYFHNTQIFPEPPHELLWLIEKSYILRDRLKSLLVTYTMREVEPDRIPALVEKVNVWRQDLISLVKGVVCAAEFELNFVPLEMAKLWAFEKADLLQEHIRGGEKLKWPRGRLQELMFEFRRAGRCFTTTTYTAAYFCGRYESAGAREIVKGSRAIVVAQ